VISPDWSDLNLVDCRHEPPLGPEFAGLSRFHLRSAPTPAAARNSTPGMANSGMAIPGGLPFTTISVAKKIPNPTIAIEKLDSSLSDENVWKLKSVLDDAKTYQEAARLASAQAFESEPLPGVGSDPWRLVFASAKYYSEQIAYPGEEFPATESGMRCVLCQQPLEDEARQRLRRFAEFVKQDVERICAQKSKLFTDALEAIRKVDVEVSFAVLAGGELCHLRNVL